MSWFVKAKKNKPKTRKCFGQPLFTMNSLFLALTLYTLKQTKHSVSTVSRLLTF